MSETPVVTVAQGALRGKTVSSACGGNFYSFQGIPYAQPPVGEYRYMPPQPGAKWTGIRDAQEEGNPCLHMDPFHNALIGDEDCLFLNVFTQKLPDSRHAIKIPVMVFVHGGGFISGSGTTKLFGPDYIVSEDVVLVTFNYRLGPLGFMTTEDDEIPGNAGLKDQVEALKWVQQNITQFGGDPDNVTIFGVSAGGASVEYLMLSPLAKGLFHKAISQSGSALSNWAFSTAGRSRTLRLAQALGCDSKDSKRITSFLREIPAEKLVESQMSALSPEELRRSVMLLPFVPTIESSSKNLRGAFLIKSPIDIIRSGNYNRVPYITGTNTNEGLFLIRDVFPDNGLKDWPKQDKDIQALLPEDAFPEVDSVRSVSAGKQLKKFYFGSKSLTEDTLNEYSQLISDTMFIYKINKTVLEHSVHTSPTFPIFYYQFAYEGEYLGIFKRLLMLQDYPGVCHSDEIGYLFKDMMLFTEDQLDPECPDLKMRTKLLTLWTNFAKTGRPSAPGITWDPVTPSKVSYLRIDEKSEMMTNLESKRIRFWDHMYHLSSLVNNSKI